ncbi:MAG TPA: hypothetical protein VGN70_02255 [Gammaproteobacteria bacterium]
MNKNIYLLLLLAIGGCAQVQYETLPPDLKTLSIDGATFDAPPAGPWMVKTHTPLELEIGKTGSSEDETVIIDAFVFKPTALEPGADFIKEVKQQEEQDTSAPRFVMKVHEVVPVSIGSATCARSHMVAEDHSPAVHSGSGKMMILEIVSLNCLHPDHPDKAAFNVGYSERFYPGDEDPDFMQKALALVNSVQITKLY